MENLYGTAVGMKKKKIAYIELETHVEIIESIFDLLQNSSYFEADFIISDKIRSSLSIEKGTLLTATPKSLLKLLQQRHYDLVIIGTVQRHFNLFKEVCRKYKVAIIVHNLNFSRASWSILLKSIWQGQLKYKLKLILKEGLFQAASVYKKADHLLVLDKTFANSSYIFLPVFFNKVDSYPQETSILKIVIPGTVSQEKRNYTHVLRTIRTFKNDVELVFLGKAEKKELQQIKLYEALLPRHIKFKYFEERISPHIFEQELLTADLLWCPIQKYTTSFGSTEIYGQTKISGSIGDAIKYGKYAIFPSFYRTELPFIIKEEYELESQMISLKSSPYDFKQEFSLDKRKIKFIKILQTLIDN